MDTQPLSINRVNKRPPSAVQLTGRLSAKELGPPARHVERVTDTKLLRDAKSFPCPSDRNPNHLCGRVQSIDSRYPDAGIDGASRPRRLLGSWVSRSPAGDFHRFLVVGGNASLHSIVQCGRSL